MQNERDKWPFRQELPSLISDLLYPNQSETNGIYLPKLEPGRGLCEVPDPGGNQLPQLTLRLPQLVLRLRENTAWLSDPAWPERECRFSFPLTCSAILAVAIDYGRSVFLSVRRVLGTLCSLPIDP